MGYVGKSVGYVGKSVGYATTYPTLIDQSDQLEVTYYGIIESERA